MEDFKPQSSLEKSLLRKLDARFLNSTLRKLSISPPGAVDLSSNDFLSLSTSPALRAAFLDHLTRGGADFPLGSGGSRLLDGNSSYASELEREIAAFHGAPAALLWNSGFDANSGLFACVPQTGDAILYDELIHASVHDGMKLCRAGRRMPFAHNSVKHLGELLEGLVEHNPSIAAGRSNVFIAVESVYSMDGDLAPLAEIVQLAERILPRGNAHIIVDEAHATGVLGPCGRGLVSQLGLEDKVFARLHTFGKSLACSGAVTLTSPLTRAYLVNYARPLIYTTFMPFPVLAGIKAAYSLLRTGATQPLVAHLSALIIRLHTSLLDMLSRYPIPISQTPDDSSPASPLLHIDAAPPQSPIFALQTPHPRSLAAHCQAAGFVVRAVVPPTVPTRRVRVCLHAGNTVGEVERFVACVEGWGRGRIGGEDGLGGRGGGGPGVGIVGGGEVEALKGEGRNGNGMVGMMGKTGVVAEMGGLDAGVKARL